MASTMLGSLLIGLGLESAQFKSGLTDAEKRMKRTQRKFQQAGKKMVSAGKSMTLGITAPFIAFAATSVKVAADARDAFAQVEASLASMGDGAGRSAEQLKVAGKELQALSTFDDSEILRDVTSVLLTFGNVAEEEFDRAQRAAVDMATKLKVDLKSATVQIGKALNDPIKGITALTRVGVDFTKEQKNQIKAMQEAGDTAGAQSIILAELERQFKGAGKAARDAVPGSDAINRWNDLREKVGEVLLKVIERVEPVLTKIADAFLNLSPATQTAIVAIVAVAAVAGPLVIVMGSIAGAIGTLLPILAGLGPALGVVKVALLALAANPVVLAFAAVVAGIYLAWKNWDKIKPIIDRVKAVVVAFWNRHVGPIFNFIKDALINAVTNWWKMQVGVAKAVAKLVTSVRAWLVNKLGAVWKAVTGKIDMVKRAFFNLYDAVVGNSYVPDMVDGIAREMARLDKVMVQPVERATSKAKQAFRDLASDVQQVMREAFPEIAAFQDLKAKRATLQQGADAGLISQSAADETRFRLRPGADGKAPVSEGLINTPAIAIPSLPDDLLIALGNIGIAAKETSDVLSNLAGNAFRELGLQLEGVLLGAQSAGDALRNFVSSLASMALDNLFSNLGTSLKIPALRPERTAHRAASHW